MHFCIVLHVQKTFRVNIFLSFFSEERRRFLLRTVQENPHLTKRPFTELEQYFKDTAEKLGVPSSECVRYYIVMHSQYLRQKKKLSDGKKPKSRWPFFKDFQQIETTLNHIVSNTKDVPKMEALSMEVTPQLNIFLAKNPKNKQNVVKMEGAYDNVAFTSGSSEEEDDCPSQSHIVPPLPLNPRKRPLSPSYGKRSVFKKGAEYMLAEMENMEPEKAQILLNNTLKFFIEHRYD